MKGKMLDTVLRMVRHIIWLDRHAIVTHALFSMPAKLSIVLSRDQASLLRPIHIHRVFTDRCRRLAR